VVYNPWLVQSGRYLYFYQGSPTFQDPVNVELDIYSMLTPYTDSDDSTDFLLEFGDAFLFWYALCQLNYLNKNFVFRQEGNIGAPDKERDTAWANLIAWDGTLVTTGDTALDLD
jgi:hypothetical protein